MALKVAVFLFTCWLMAGSIVVAEDYTLRVGDIDFPSLRWGEQKVVFDLYYDGQLVKFLVIETEVQFEGTYLNPNRRARTDCVISPGDTGQVEATILIPGNYGKADITLRVYDVVDTLDDISLGKLVIEQPFVITFNMPDGAAPYFQERLTLPPRVEDHPWFDNEFSRILFVMLEEEKSPGEIADLVMCDTSYVEEKITDFKSFRFLREDSAGTSRPTFPIISTKEAEKGKKLASKLAEQLADHFAERGDEYRKTLDSLIETGRVDPDTNLFFNGGTVLYRPYPVISALVLWWALGEDFISDPEPLMIFEKTDLCNAKIGEYMYAVHGGPALKGTNFFDLRRTGGTRFRILYGDSLPDLICDSDFLRYRDRPSQRVVGRHAEHDLPETYMLDSSAVTAGIQPYVQGTGELLKDAREELADIAESFGHEELTPGYLYWFWDLTVSRTLDKLIEKGTVARRGNGQFRFDGVGM